MHSKHFTITSENLSEMELHKMEYIIGVYNEFSTIHRVSNGKLLEEQNFTDKLYRLLLSQHNSTGMYSFKSYIPENVLKYSERNLDIIWYVKPQVKHFLFSDHIEIENGPRKIPYTLFHASNGGLKVFCTKRKPKPGVKLYKAPYLNSNGAGSVCLGSARKKKNMFYDDIIHQFEEEFFNSVFTATHDNKLLIGKNSIIKYYDNEVLNTKLLRPLNKRL